MQHRRHTPANLIPTPSPDDIESARHHLSYVIDGALHALLVLCPDTTTWSVPVGALDEVVQQHPGFVRGRRRVHDLIVRVREHVADVHHQDLDELQEHVRSAMADASEAGWRLGLMMSRTSGSSS